MFDLRYALSGLLICTLLSSCATIFNSRYQRITINTTKPSTIIINSDTVLTSKNMAQFRLRRSKEAVQIISITDSITKEVPVKSRTSSTYYTNILNYGPGFIIDLYSTKRHAYPDEIFLNSTDTISKFKRYRIPLKGDLLLNGSFPHFNIFKLRPDGQGTKASAGFFGGSLGLDYYYTAKRFLNISGSAVLDFFLPIPAPVRYSHNRQVMNSVYASLSNNYRIDAFSVGYGLAFARNNWKYVYHDVYDGEQVRRDDIFRTNNSLGFIFSSYLQTRTNFSIGILYRPTFYRLNTNNHFQYEHLISVDIATKLRIMKKRTTKDL